MRKIRKKITSGTWYVCAIKINAQAVRLPTHKNVSIPLTPPVPADLRPLPRVLHMFCGLAVLERAQLSPLPFFVVEDTAGMFYFNFYIGITDAFSLSGLLPLKLALELALSIEFYGMPHLVPPLYIGILFAWMGVEWDVWGGEGYCRDHGIFLRFFPPEV